MATAEVRESTPPSNCSSVKARIGVFRLERTGKLVLMHISVERSILCFGTPVVLVSTRNEDGTTNVAPMSSAWWLVWNLRGLQRMRKRRMSNPKEKMYGGSSTERSERKTG